MCFIEHEPTFDKGTVGICGEQDCYSCLKIVLGYQCSKMEGVNRDNIGKISHISP